MYVLNDHVVALSVGNTTWAAISLAFIVMNLSVPHFFPWRLKSPLELKMDHVVGVTPAAKDGLVATTPATATTSSSLFV